MSQDIMIWKDAVMADRHWIRWLQKQVCFQACLQEPWLGESLSVLRAPGFDWLGAQWGSGQKLLLVLSVGMFAGADMSEMMAQQNLEK